MWTHGSQMMDGVGFVCGFGGLGMILVALFWILILGGFFWLLYRLVVAIERQSGSVG